MVQILQNTVYFYKSNNSVWTVMKNEIPKTKTTEHLEILVSTEHLEKNEIPKTKPQNFGDSNVFLKIIKMIKPKLKL